MSLLFETICIRRGTPERIERHAARMNDSRRTLFGCTDRIDLQAVIAGSTIPDGPLLRCRVVYGTTVVGVEFTPYDPRPVRTLRVVRDDRISYDHKYQDRSALNRLVEGCGADDVIIVRGGMVTDSSFANLVFAGGGSWVTPSTPLLRGTRRAQLIAEGVLREEAVGEKDIRGYDSVMLINAMRGPDPAAAVPIGAILEAAG
jgi:4-amino-4-deoxychorismate lyase